MMMMVTTGKSSRFMRDDYRRELAEREIKVEKSDFNIDNMLTTMRQYSNT